MLSLLNIFVTFIKCLCDFESSCYDYFDQKCKQIDGIKYIGREKNNGFCVIDSQIFNEIDYCFSLYNYVCVTKNRNSCINILNNPHFLAIQDKTQICLSLNDQVSSTKDQNRSLAFIKEGFCISDDGRVTQGNILNRENQAYQCSKNIQRKIDPKFKCLEDQCLDARNDTCTNISHVAGITENGICVFENTFHINQISCNQKYCIQINNQNFSTCIQYASNSVVGKIIRNNQCIKIGDQFDNDDKIICKSSFCRFSNQSTVTCVDMIKSANFKIKGISEKGDCILDVSKIQKLYLLSDGNITCSSDKCYDGKSCIQLGSDQNSLSKLSDQSCASLNTPNSISCFQSYPACLDENKTCQMVSNNNPESIGYTSNGQCVKQNQQYSDILYCSNQYCISKLLDSSYSCITFDGSAQAMGIDSKGQCLNSTQPAQSCFLSLKICQDLTTKYCLDISLNDLLCTNSGKCYQMSIDSIHQYIGRDKNYQCLQDSKSSLSGLLVDKCLNNLDAICKKSDSTQCTIYTGSTSLNISGIDKNGTCLDPKTPTSNLLKCLQNYCIQKDSNGQSTCLLIDGSTGRFGIDINGNCLDANTPGAIKCANISNNVCLDPTIQKCFSTVDYGTNKTGCILNSTCQVLSLNQYIGRDKNLQCLIDQQNIQGTLVDICYNDPDKVCKSNDQLKCVLYSNSSIYLGYIQTTGICAQLNVQISNSAYQNVLHLDKKYCQSSDFTIQNLVAPYVGRDSIYQKCLKDSEPATQVEFCVQGYCQINNSCKQIGFDSQNIAKLADGTCGLQKQSTAIQCACLKCDVCLLNSQCYFVQNMSQTSGIDTQGNCLQAEQYTSNLLKCQENYCIKKNTNKQQACFLIDGSLGQAGIDINRNCLDINTAGAIKCVNKNNQICFDQQNQKCVETVKYGIYQAGCILNSTCQELSILQYVGRDKNLQCLLNNQNPDETLVDICLNDSDNICKLDDQTKCVLYRNSNVYLGYISNTGICAQLNKFAKYFVLNLDQKYCKTSDQTIQILQAPYVGRDSKSQNCLKESELSAQVEFCIKGYCVANNSCQQIGFDGKQVAKLQNQKCSTLYQSVSIECAFNKYDVCLFNQVCYQLQYQNINTSGIDVNGNCLKRDQSLLKSDIKKCENYHCLVVDNTNNYAQCSLIDGIKYAGINGQGLCLALNQAKAKLCPTYNQYICFDKDEEYCTSTDTFGAMKRCSLSGFCYPLSSSLYVGRDQNQQCLENQQKASQSIDMCLDNQDLVCFDQKNQLCAIYPDSINYLGYIIDNKQCAVNNQLTKEKGAIANLKNLKTNYCQDSQGYIRQLDSQIHVGVQSNNFQCLSQNKKTDYQIIQCYDGYCITNSSCQNYNQTFIGRNSSYICLQEGQTIGVQCAIFLSACLDIDQKACFIINDIVESHSGLQQNGQCAKSGQFYQNISMCSFNHCKLKENPLVPNSREGCFPFDANLKRVGIDSNGYCVQQDEKNAKRCMEGQFCLNQQLKYACQSLLFSYKENRFARQTQTGFCLPYLDKNSNGDNIEICVKGSCLFTVISPTSIKNYCFTEGTIFNGNLIVGTDVKGICILENQKSSTQIETCLGISYCILTNEQGQFQCQALSEPSEPLGISSNLKFRAKNVNQTCQDINTENSIGCLNGRYCLDISINQCVNLNPDDPKKLGRNEYNQRCLEQGISPAIKCALGYCIQKGTCVELSKQNPGKEKETDLCLPEKSEGQKGVDSCYKQGYCLMQNSNSGLNSCYQLDFNNPNAIGIEQDTQNCIPSNKPKAVMCAIQRYCLDPKTQSCIYIDANKNMCADQNGKCTNIPQCYSCNIDQCLGTGGICQNLVQDTKIYCINNQGKCAYILSGDCNICPDQYCIIKNNCLNQIALLSQLKLNECFLIDSYKKCVLKKIDQIDSSSSNFCSNSKGICQDLSKNNNQCLQCPKYYTNPGNQQCYSIDQKYTFQPNSQEVFFQMKLTYVKEDCYDQQKCELNLKCQTGCFSCLSKDYCTQCIEGYFLYQESDNKQTCIQCHMTLYQNKDLQPYYKNIPTYKCLDCSSDYGFWNNATSTYKTCSNYVMSLDNTVQIVHNNLQASNFFVDQINEQPVLKKLDSINCSNGCYSCMQTSTSMATCLQCNPGFFLLNGSCLQCPHKCIKCQYATNLSGFLKLLNVESLDSMQNSNLIFVCLECQVTYMVSYNLQSCKQCGALCDYCQYENFQSVWNYYQDQLKIFSLDEFNQKLFIQKCTKCQDGYILSQNGEDCVLETIQNCEQINFSISNSSQIINLSQNIWAFIPNASPLTFKQQCQKCSYGYSLQNQSECIQMGCQSIGECNSCLYSNSDNENICQFCAGGRILSILQNPPNCQYEICKVNVYGCSECYLYKISEQQDYFYQCTKCLDQNSIPSFNGCIKCPTGCSTCYEGTREFNLTNSIIYDKNYLTLQQRLSYNKQNQYSLYCTKCLDGFYFDQQQKLCLQIYCGQNCLLCKLINNKPQCMQCNYDKLQDQISQLSFFIGKFYFNSKNILNFNSMVTITAAGNDCQVCPMMCETCVNSINLDVNPLYLYDSQCLSCKQSIGSNPDLKNYKITYDKIRRKCYFCNNSEQGCYFKKQIVIYTQCLDTGSSLGVGTQQNPINYNKLNEVNIDSLILDEIDFNQAIVYYNELQVKQLEVQLIFMGESCVELKPQLFATTLKDKVRSLETAILNITTLHFNQNKSITFQQLDAFGIKGFDQINIEGIEFKQYSNTQNFGFIAQDKNLTTLNLLNCSFFQFSQQNYYKQYLQLSLSTLQQSSIILTNVQFENIQILNQQQLIQITNILANSSIYIEFDQVQFNMVTFSNSNLVKLNFQKTHQQMSNLIFTKSLIQNSALVVDIQQNSIHDQYVGIQFDNITFYQSVFSNKSQILNSNFLNQLTINKIIFNQCNFSQSLSDANPLIISNQFEIKGFYVQSCKIDYFSFLQQQDSKTQLGSLVQQSSFENFSIQQNQFIQNNNFLFQFSSQISANVKINGIFIKENIFKNSMSSKLFQLLNLNEIEINNVTTINNNYFTVIKVDHAQSVLISNIFQTQNSDLLVSPQICQLNQVQQNINLLNITQQNIVMFSNIISIDNKFNKFKTQPLHISIINYNSTSTKLLYYNVTQSSALIAITSRQNTFLNMSNIYFQEFLTIPQIKKNSIGQIAYGIYFTAPTLIATVLDSNFTHLQQDSQFNWIQGSLKYISFLSCNFINEIRNFNSINQVNGGFFNLISEQLSAKYSFFINGNALNGGAFYWISQNKGGLYLLKCQFLNNTASSQDYFESSGGAVYIDGLQSFSYDLSIEQSIFQNNFALLNGGAIQIKTTKSPRSVISIQYSQFYDNLSIKGSDLNIDSSKSAKSAVIIQNITVINNVKNTMELNQSAKSLLIKQLKLVKQNQASLITMNGIFEVQILKSYFSISCNNFQPNIQSSTINLEYQKILLITNVEYFYDFSNFYEDSSFFQNLITVMQINKMQLINTSIRNNRNIQINLPTTQQSQNIAYYNSQECIINLLRVNQNICQTCNEGTIKILANYLFVKKSTFESNTSIYGSALFIEQAKDNTQNQKLRLKNLYILESQFYNNSALKSGGAIYINGSSIQIKYTAFYLNKAKQQGGAVYLENSQENILLNTLEIVNCSFSLNQAFMGGSIGSTTYQGIDSLSHNQFYKNKAISYGQNIQTSPTHLVVYINNIKQSGLKELIVKNHLGGQLQNTIEFRLINDQNEELLDLSSDEILNLKILSGSGYISMNQLQHKNGKYNLTDQILIYGKKGQYLQLQITSKLIQVPQLNKQEKIFNYDKSYSFILSIQFALNCPVGKVIQQIYNKYDVCSECKESTYSFFVSDSCSSCPNTNVFCS
ncbi:hypothetical protein ABPG72_011855, partial [Tetrahymena utriculariae]